MIAALVATTTLRIAYNIRSQMMRSLVAIAAAAACLALAFLPARRATAGVTMPYDQDHFREMAYAQSIADGKPLADPFYRGETIWYNPLFAATIAGLSKIAGTDVPTTFVRSGPFLSVLAQALFFITIATLIGPWPAFLALVFLLFVPPYEFPWAAPAVTPWLFPSAFASGVFYLGLLLCWAAIRHDTPRWWAALGGCLGVVFLGHSAPALILGLCAVASVLAAATPGARFSRERLPALFVLISAAVVACSPFLYSIVIRYGLRVVHVEPLNWVWNDIAVSRAGSVLLNALLSPVGLLRIIGLAVLLRHSATDRGAFVVVSWTVAAAMFVGYGWLQQLLDFRGVPPLVPQHHFYFYLKAASYVLAGVGAWAMLTWLVPAVASYARWRPLQRAQASVAAAAAVGVVCSLISVNYAAYLEKRDFQEYRREALEFSEEFAETQLLERLRAQTPPHAVVLATATDSIYRVAPAGRAVLGIPSAQSNPYIPHGERELAQKRMLAALMDGDSETFTALADEYRVTHVMLGPEDVAALDASQRSQPIRQVSRRGGYALYERIRRDPGLPTLDSRL